MRPKKKSQELSACETLIMKAVWDAKDDIAVQELIVQLKQQYNKDYARTTVVTFLKKMSEKGYVSTYRIGNASYVHAERDENQYVREKLNRDRDFWFGGSPSKLLSAALYDGKTISKEEIRKMKELLDELDH